MRPIPFDARCRMRLADLDRRVTRTEPNALLMIDQRRRMLYLRFQESKDLYDLTEFEISADGETVTFAWMDYTQLLFWLREEHNSITASL